MWGSTTCRRPIRRARQPETRWSRYGCGEPKTSKGHGWEGLFRFDHLVQDQSTSAVDSERNRTIAGVAYWFPQRRSVSSALLFDYEQVDNADYEPLKANERRWTILMLIGFRRRRQRVNTDFSRAKQARNRPGVKVILMHLTSRALHSRSSSSSCWPESRVAAEAGQTAAHPPRRVSSPSTAPAPSIRSPKPWPKNSSARPGTRITVGISGTGGGFQKFCRDEIDIADASRPIRPTEAEACAKAGVEYIELPVAYDGLAIVVHPKNTWATSMTVAELKKLWEPAAQGKIMRWNQVRTGWPDQRDPSVRRRHRLGHLRLLHRGHRREEKASRGDYTSSEDDNVIVQGVERRRERARLLRLRLLRGEQGQAQAGRDRRRERHQRQAGPIAPSPETVEGRARTGRCRGPIFIYAKVKALERPEVAELRRVLSRRRASPLVREVGYIPLTDASTQLVRSRFTARKTGSMFERHRQSQSGDARTAADAID